MLKIRKMIETLDHKSLYRIYPIITAAVILHIEGVKSTDKTASLADIILDFAKKMKLDVDLVIDAVSDDMSLSDAIRQDCSVRGIYPYNGFVQRNGLLDDW